MSFGSVFLFFPLDNPLYIPRVLVFVPFWHFLIVQFLHIKNIRNFISSSMWWLMWHSCHTLCPMFPWELSIRKSSFPESELLSLVLFMTTEYYTIILKVMSWSIFIVHQAYVVYHIGKYGSCYCTRRIWGHDGWNLLEIRTYEKTLGRHSRILNLIILI